LWVVFQLAGVAHAPTDAPQKVASLVAAHVEQ